MKIRLRFWSTVTALTITSMMGMAFAATQNFQSHILFSGPLTLTKIRNLDFGIVKALQSGTYILSTSGTVTPSNGGITLGGNPHAGELFLTGSIVRSLHISTSNFVSHNGVTPYNPTCSYNGSPEVLCNTLVNASPPAAGKTLRLGLTLLVNGTQAPDTTAKPSFNVNVIYN